MNDPAQIPKTDIKVFKKQLEILLGKNQSLILQKETPSSNFVDLNFKVDQNLKQSFKDFARSEGISMKQAFTKAFYWYKFFREGKQE